MPTNIFTDEDDQFLTVKSILEKVIEFGEAATFVSGNLSFRLCFINSTQYNHFIISKVKIFNKMMLT